MFVRVCTGVWRYLARYERQPTSFFVYAYRRLQKAQGYFYGNINYIENCISNTQLYSDKSAGGIVGEAIDNEAFNRIENCIDNSVVVKY